MRIRQYFLMIDYALWEVIVNEDLPPPKRTVDGVKQTYHPTTADEKLARKNELKARGGNTFYTDHIELRLDGNVCIMDAPPSPNHIFDFPANEPTSEADDPVIEAEEIKEDLVENPEEDSEKDLKTDINEDEEEEEDKLEEKEDDDWLMVRSHLRELPCSHTAPIRVAMHHQEIRGLCIRAESLEHMYGSLVRKIDGVSDAQVANDIAIGELQPKVSTIEEEVHALTEQGVLIAGKLDETETQVLEMQDKVNNYLCGQVDALREEVNGLQGMRQQVQTLKTALQEVLSEDKARMVFRLRLFEDLGDQEANGLLFWGFVRLAKKGETRGVRGDAEAQGSSPQHAVRCALHRGPNHGHGSKGQAAGAHSRLRSDDKMSQLLTQLQSQHEVGSGSGSSGAGDDEPGKDEDAGEDEDADGDEDRQDMLHMVFLGMYLADITSFVARKPVL
ncbi:hypothetical protein Tco_0815713 [Tanacetum coccineum]